MVKVVDDVDVLMSKFVLLFSYTALGLSSIFPFLPVAVVVTTGCIIPLPM